MFKKVLIAGDNHAENLKSVVKKQLSNLGIDAIILDSGESDYVDCAQSAVMALDKFDALILICGTGVGVCMASSKFSGVRAVLAKDEQTAYFARRHENANVLCLAGGYDDGVNAVKVSNALTQKIVKTFFTTDFEGGRHLNRINKFDGCGEKNG